MFSKAKMMPKRRIVPQMNSVKVFPRVSKKPSQHRCGGDKFLRSNRPELDFVALSAREIIMTV